MASDLPQAAWLAWWQGAVTLSKCFATKVVTEIVKTLASLNLKVATLQLKQLGRLNLGELKEGDYLELMENEVKI